MPLPAARGFVEELADAVRDLPLHRYPDGQMTRLREELAARARTPRRRHLDRERLERES